MVATRSTAQTPEQIKAAAQVTFGEGKVCAEATARFSILGEAQALHVGVTLDDRGSVHPDDTLRTSLPGIWAVGNVTGALQFTHAAARMGLIAADNALSRLAQTVHACPTWSMARQNAAAQLISPAKARATARRASDRATSAISQALRRRGSPPRRRCHRSSRRRRTAGPDR